MKNKRLNRKNVVTWMFLVLVLMVRVVLLDKIPGGNQDEAYAGYNAWALAEYGIDSHGYTNPVYFTAWGSGMNVLYSYLCIPVIKIFGMSEFTIRIPMVISSILTVVGSYFLGKEMRNEKMGILFAFLVAISPWNYMLARWGLESNLAPACIVFGFLFWVKGLQKEKYFFLSAFFWGISLYAYAVLWIFVPVLLFVMFIYCVFIKKLELML